MKHFGKNKIQGKKSRKRKKKTKKADVSCHLCCKKRLLFFHLRRENQSAGVKFFTIRACSS